MISIIAAMSKNHVIGKNNKLPWYLPADLRHFKKITTAKPIIMGRKTFESIGKKPLPERKNIIITRDENYQAEGCTVTNSLNDAIKAAGNTTEIMIVGGSQIYKQALEVADRMYITIIDEKFEGDAFFPEWDEQAWQEISREDFSADEKNRYDFSFVTFEKR